MARVFDVLLEVYAGLTKTRGAQTHGGRKVIRHFFRSPANPNANAAAARCALKNDRVSPTLGFFEGARKVQKQTRARQSGTSTRDAISRAVCFSPKARIC